MISKRHITEVSKDAGFSLLEFVIYIAILAVLMTVVMQSFTTTMRRTGQQTGITETKIEAEIGLDLLRSDLEHAGFGLPWSFAGNPLPYNEPNPFSNNGNIPLAFSSENLSGNSFNGSDYLVVRGTNVIRAVAGQKWSHVGRDAAHAVEVPLDISDEALIATDNIMVIHPEPRIGRYRELVMNGTNYVTQPTAAALANYAPDPTPNDPDDVKYLVYGLSSVQAAAPFNGTRMPFNRTDYYISNDAGIVPTQCSPGTGVLVKSDVNQGADPAPVAPSTADFAVLPVMDCVADFQVVYYLDTNGDGGWDQRRDGAGLAGLTADQIRDQVKSVRYYILSHEGGRDTSYTHPNPLVNVDELQDDGTPLGVGRQFDLTATGGNWANYRWRVDSVAVTPRNLQ